MTFRNIFKTTKELSYHEEEMDLDVPLKFIDEEERLFYASIRPRKFIIRQRSKGKKIWEIFIIVIAVYNAVTLPLQISFPVVQEYFSGSNALLSIEWTIDFFFFVDIFIGFITSYQDVFTGDEIFAPRLIAKKYLKGEFLIDFLSTFPFESMGKLFNIEASLYYTLATLCKLLKILRIRRIPKLIANSNLLQEDKALGLAVTTVFILCIYVHCIACLLWSIFSIEQVWVPPTDFMFAET